MAIVANALVFLVIVALVHCSTKEDRKAWLKHSRAISRFACQPRPRSFRATTLFKHIEDDRDVDPFETVLYRCDSQSGCCKDRSLECKPRTAEIVRLPFFSLKLRDHVFYEAQNHTSCSCQRRDVTESDSIIK